MLVNMNGPAALRKVIHEMENNDQVLSPSGFATIMAWDARWWSEEAIPRTENPKAFVPRDRKSTRLNSSHH